MGGGEAQGWNVHRRGSSFKDLRFQKRRVSGRSSRAADKGEGLDFVRVGSIVRDSIMW
jgi:hypothetical protein